jgi:hypothetical protein
VRIELVGASVVRLAAACLTCIGIARAEVISIESTSTGLLSSSAPTLTFYWKGKDPKAVLLFVPGGAGQVGLSLDTVEPRGEYRQMMKRLSDPQATSGRYDVVLIDSPYPLSPNSPYPSQRGTTDHIKRIEAAALYYKQKTGLPVWVMGHSNGGISLTAFIKYLQSEGKMDLVSGMVAMDIRSESRFNPPIDFPVLFIHHRQDGCQYANGNEVMKIYNKLKEFDKAPTAFVWITGGEAQGDPCSTGFHMYHGAGAEVTGAIDDFLAQVYP